MLESDIKRVRNLKNLKVNSLKANNLKSLKANNLKRNHINDILSKASLREGYAKSRKGYFGLSL